MGKFVDITGEKYGRLVAIRSTENRTKSGGVVWLFKCECGKYKQISANSVRSGLVRSCGCIVIKHKMAGTRLYNIWTDMKQRCYNSNYYEFHLWGGRGIIVCEEWRNDFQAFYDWAMNNGYSDDLSLDRIDSTGNYEPSNCRWASAKEQARNTSHNRKIIIDGVAKLLCEWLEISPITASTYHKRIKRGMTDKEALFTPHLRKRKVIQ